MQRIDSVSDLVTALGGPAATAEVLGTTPQSIVNWRTAGHIPARLFKMHRAKLRRRRGLSISDDLWGFVEPAE